MAAIPDSASLFSIVVNLSDVMYNYYLKRLLWSQVIGVPAAMGQQSTCPSTANCSNTYYAYKLLLLFILLFNACD